MASGISTPPVATLHYIYDPLCGWCYAAAPLAQAASQIPGLLLSLHGGGMLSDHNRRQMSAAWRDYVLPHDKRIAALSGQIFGQAYFQGLLEDGSVILDSTPPITAVLCAQSLQGLGLAMLEKIQAAHYQHGMKVAEQQVLIALATELGLDATKFAQRFAELSPAATAQHIQQSRELLAQVGGNGFPSFVLEQPGQALQVLNASHHLGQPASWRAFIAAQIASHFTTTKD